jgi:hypothetical protein
MTLIILYQIFVSSFYGRLCRVFLKTVIFFECEKAPGTEPECRSVHEDLSTELMRQSRKKCIFRDILKKWKEFIGAITDTDTDSRAQITTLSE